MMFLVDGEELRSIIREVLSEVCKPQSKEQNEYLTAAQVREMLHVSAPTLWRWNTTGYLKSLKAGKKNFYRAADVKKIMQ